ncbi:hypothetical protein BSKO_08077 [Bryopsis sp. KO-2023]|nr:hypothetical protein BSKO_08077 [Bryopsis sp. KO-2023]
MVSFSGTAFACLCMVIGSAAARVARTLNSENVCESRGSLAEYATYFDDQLRSKILPFWHTKVDYENGGYALDEAKYIVEQTRMIWTFSEAHLNGITVPGKDNLKAAAHGFDFVSSKMLDPVNGGYYWSIDNQGNIKDSRKFMYGQAFVLYSFATYFKASGDSKAKNLALDLFRVLVNKAQDTETGMGGWFEHFTADWTVLRNGNENDPVAPHGLKTANAILHILEGLIPLLEVSGDDQVRSILERTVDTDMLLFFKSDPSGVVSQLDFKGNPVGRSDIYAHAVESAWLKVEAEVALGRQPDWGGFDTYMRFFISKGIDPSIGGIVETGELVWWAQAEFIAAVALDKARRGGSEYDDALLKLVDFVACNMVDPSDGIWWWSVNSDGSIRDGRKVNKWKTGYHDVRGITMMIKAY